MSLQVGSSDLDKMLRSSPAGKICIVFFHGEVKMGMAGNISAGNCGGRL